MDERHAKLLRWVSDHDGVFTRGIALDFGLTGWTLRRGLRSGEWRPYRQCCLVAGARDTPRARLRAALLRAGRNALATGPSALRLYGLGLGDDPREPTSIGAHIAYVTVPANRHVSIADAVILRDREQPEGRDRSGFPVVTRERAIVNSLRVLAPEDARAVLFRSLQLGWTTAASLDHWSQRLRKTRGVRQLRAMSTLAATGAHAESEVLCQQILIVARIAGWTANERVYDQHGLIGVVDILFPELDLVIEIDGRAWHSTPDRFESDRFRQNRLVAAGYFVLRFTWQHLQDPNHVVRTVHAAINSRRTPARDRARWIG